MVKCAALPVANKELLTKCWRAWVEEAGHSGLHWQLLLSELAPRFISTFAGPDTVLLLIAHALIYDLS